MSAFVFCSPAKVNLQLSLLFKRGDGYHEIETLMHAIDLADRLVFFRTNQAGLKLSCTDPRLPTDESNLVVKAANAFQEVTSVPLSLEIHLQKHVPFGAGLGGGSSNAATTIHALNAIYGTNLKDEEMQALAAKIGSDVPFFFSKEGAAICRGRGEIVEDALPLTGSFTLFTPPIHLSTASVYEKFAESARRRICRRINDLPVPIWNDLEPAAFTLSPKLKEMAILFEESGFTCLMSGSGSCLLLFGKGKMPLGLSSFCKKISFCSKKPHTWYPTITPFLREKLTI